MGRVLSQIGSGEERASARLLDEAVEIPEAGEHDGDAVAHHAGADDHRRAGLGAGIAGVEIEADVHFPVGRLGTVRRGHEIAVAARSEEHTAEHQSLMRNSYAASRLIKQTT